MRKGHSLGFVFSAAALLIFIVAACTKSTNPGLDEIWQVMKGK
jgi:hypothetical protein